MAQRPTRIDTSAAHRAALDTVITALRRRYGPHIIRSAGDLVAPDPDAGMSVLSTGSLGVDLIAGGLPRGAMAEYAGVDGAGKETLAHTALARAQRGGGLVLLLDADGASDPDALGAAGVDVPSLMLACPTTADEAWHALVALAGCGALDLLLVTSLPGLTALPGADGLRLSRHWLPRLRLALRGRRTTVLVTNAPTSSRAGEVQAWDGWDTVGGAAVAQAATLRVALRPAGLRFGPHGDVVGLGATVKAVKHRGLPHGPPLSLELTEAGTHHALELVTLGLSVGLIARTGLGLAMDEALLGRTEQRAAMTVASDVALATTLEARIRRAWRDTTASNMVADGAAR